MTFVPLAPSWSMSTQSAMALVCVEIRAWLAMLPYWDEGRKVGDSYPVMLARIEDATGRLVSLHRT
jgi:hypothetical protein